MISDLSNIILGAATFIFQLRIAYRLNFSGAINVNSEPSGASVYINGEIHGRTPLIVENIPAKKAILKIEKPGQGIYVKDDLAIFPQDTIDLGVVKLKPAGYLTIRGEPAGAEIYLDDRYLGKIPLSSLTIPEGRHSLRISKPFYLTENRPINIIGNQNLTIDVNLNQFDGEWDLYYESGIIYDFGHLDIVQDHSNLSITYSGVGFLNEDKEIINCKASGNSISFTLTDKSDGDTRQFSLSISEDANDLKGRLFHHDVGWSDKQGNLHARRKK